MTLKLLPTSSAPGLDVIQETGTLDALKAKLDKATDSYDRITLGIQYVLLKHLDDEFKRMKLTGERMTRRETITAFSAGLAFSTFNLATDMALRGGAKDVMDMVVQITGASMDAQTEVLKQLIDESTVPTNTTKQ